MMDFWNERKIWIKSVNILVSNQVLLHIKDIGDNHLTPPSKPSLEGVVVLKGEIHMGKMDQSTITENISLWEVVFGILDMSRYNIVFGCIAWSNSPLATENNGMPSYLLTSFINCQVLRLYIKIKSN